MLCSPRWGADVLGLSDGPIEWPEMPELPKLLSPSEILEADESSRDTFLASVRPSDFDSVLFEAAMSDAEAGKMLGPFHSLSEVEQATGGTRVAVSRRFGVQQTEKVRPCDDFTRGGRHVNAGFASARKLRLPRLEVFLRHVLCLVLRWTSPA